MTKLRRQALSCSNTDGPLLPQSHGVALKSWEDAKLNHKTGFRERSTFKALDIGQEVDDVNVIEILLGSDCSCSK